ncbi:hypothetical protein PAHAL_1G223500 [Panicum hallii]|uniref:Uncharacterized protein n=1 Tax=Panicum hallii TaxID=206008 RepID=A0A2T8KW10_9POAL|nr:hypothetical protein PAHAL_1G223500 [Panicum hallii]
MKQLTSCDLHLIIHPVTIIPIVNREPMHCKIIPFLRDGSFIFKRTTISISYEGSILFVIQLQPINNHLIQFALISIHFTTKLFLTVINFMLGLFVNHMLRLLLHLLLNNNIFMGPLGFSHFLYFMNSMAHVCSPLTAISHFL